MFRFLYLYASAICSCVMREAPAANVLRFVDIAEPAAPRCYALIWSGSISWSLSFGKSRLGYGDAYARYATFIRPSTKVNFFE